MHQTQSDELLQQLQTIQAELKHCRKQVEDYEAVLNSSFDGILITDGEGNVLMVNQAYERLTGIKIDEITGKNMRDMLDPTYMPNSVVLMVLEEKKTVTIPFSFM
jgi:PAS domain S-box-containing protein